jgi:hypothetical protein
MVTSRIKTTSEGLAFVKEHGVVLSSGRGPVPALAEAIAGEPIRGSWWGHAKSHQNFELINGIVDSGDVLLCKLVDGKLTYVHRRLWPALVKLASRFPKAGLAEVRNEHTATGAHRSRTTPFPKWVPPDVTRAAAKLSVEDAEKMLEPLLRAAPKKTKRRPAQRA